MARYPHVVLRGGFIAQGGEVDRMIGIVVVRLESSVCVTTSETWRFAESLIREAIVGMLLALSRMDRYRFTFHECASPIEDWVYATYIRGVSSQLFAFPLQFISNASFKIQMQMINRLSRHLLSRFTAEPTLLVSDTIITLRLDLP